MDKPDPQRSPDLDAQQEIDVAALHEPILREMHDPTDGHEPVPLFLILLFGSLLFWGGFYLASYNGGFRGDILNPDPAARYAGAAAEPKAVDPLVLGEKLFKANCVSCHQAAGQGVPGQYPPLAGSEWVLGPEYRIVRIVLKGLEGPVTVLGHTYNGSMPTFEATFKDEKLAAVLTYLRASWGNTAPGIAPESVAATRAAVKDRNKPWKAEELLAVVAPDYVPPAAGAAAPSAPADGAKAPADGKKPPADGAKLPDPNKAKTGKQP